MSLLAVAKRFYFWTSMATILLALFVLSPVLFAATPLKKIRLAYSAFAYANPPFWIAHDLKLFEKYGLDSELVYVSGARPMQAMLGGSIDVSQDGVFVINLNLSPFVLSLSKDSERILQQLARRRTGAIAPTRNSS